MADVTYGQKEPMENEAMVRTLDAQARAIWPQERILLKRIFHREGLDVVDVGCGTGEIASRIAREFAPRRLTGIDLAEPHIRRAREMYGDIKNLAFRQGDATALPLEADSVDVAICRHMLQAVPDAMGVVREMIRVVKPGGHVYALAEDYGMLFFQPTTYDTDEFYREYAGKAAAKAGSDLRQGRKMPSMLMTMGCAEIAVNYLCVDTLRVDRALLAEIFLHWRDGFAEWISAFAGKPPEDVRNRFNDMIECCRRPDGYAAWIIPSISARVTAETKKVYRSGEDKSSPA